MISTQSQELFNAIDAVDPIENTKITDPIKTFKEALEEGADVNAKDNNGNTPLINIINLLPVASDNEGVYYEMVDLLLKDEKLDVSLEIGNGDDKRNALDLATLYFIDKLVSKLLNHKSTDFFTREKSIEYIRNTNHEQALAIEKQIRESIDKNPLISAVRNDDLQKVKELSNNPDKKQWGAIYYALVIAAQNGHTAIVEALIKAGANVNAQSKDGCTALMIAAQNGHTAIVEALIKAEANVNAQSKDGCTALMIAAHDGYTAIVEALIKAGANVNAQSKGDRTALMLAMMNVASKEQSDNEIKIIKLLLQKGANIDVKDISKKISLNLESSSQVQIYISLLGLTAEYRLQDVKEFLLNEHDLVKKLNEEEFKLSQELKGIVEEIAKMPQKQCVSATLDELDNASQEGSKKR